MLDVCCKALALFIKSVFIILLFCRIDICSFIIFDVGKTPDEITAFTGIDDFTDQEVTEAKAEHAWLKDVFLPKKKSQVT